MNISFPIIHFTEANSIEKWEQIGNHPFPFPSLVKKTPSKEKKYIVLLLDLITICSLCLWLTDKFLRPVLFFIFITSMALMILVLLVILPAGEDENKIYPHFRYFNQKIHFSRDSIDIIPNIKSNKISFPYSEIDEIVFWFLPYKDMNLEGHIAVFSWDSHEYFIPIQSTLEKEKLMEVLKYIYEKRVPLKEYGKKGKKLHLLKPIEEVEFEEQYLDLIEEIGEKDDKK